MANGLGRGGVPVPHPTSEQSAAGGRAAAAARRKKRTMQETAKVIMNMAAHLLLPEIPEAVKFVNPGATVQEGIVIQQAVRAIKFMDTKSAEFLRDLIGEKPEDTVNVNGYVEALKKVAGDKY